MDSPCRSALPTSSFKSAEHTRKRWLPRMPWSTAGYLCVLHKRRPTRHRQDDAPRDSPFDKKRRLSSACLCNHLRNRKTKKSPIQKKVTKKSATVTSAATTDKGQSKQVRAPLALKSEPKHSERKMALPLPQLSFGDRAPSRKMDGPLHCGEK